MLWYDGNEMHLSAVVDLDKGDWICQKNLTCAMSKPSEPDAMYEVNYSGGNLEVLLALDLGKCGVKCTNLVFIIRLRRTWAMDDVFISITILINPPLRNVYQQCFEMALAESLCAHSNMGSTARFGWTIICSSWGRLWHGLRLGLGLTRRG